MDGDLGDEQVCALRVARESNHDAASLDDATSPSLPVALIQALLADLVAGMVGRVRVR